MRKIKTKVTSGKMMYTTPKTKEKLEKIKTLAEDYGYDPLINTASPIYDHDFTSTIKDLCVWAEGIEEKQNELIEGYNKLITQLQEKE